MRRQAIELCSLSIFMAAILIALSFSTFAADCANAPPREVWDLNAIKTMPLNVEALSEMRTRTDGKEYIEREILYTSQITNGKPVRALAYVTIPVGADKPLPALVSMRGFWGPSHKGNSVNYAREYGVVSLGVQIPEGQTRAVWPDGFTEIADHEKDFEKSYFYLLAMAAMRGVSYLQSLPEVNAERIGITGVSRGGMAALIANGVDDRIRMALAVSATGLSPETVARVKASLEKNRESVLLMKSSLAFNPLDYARTQHGATFLIIGTQDQVFPYTDAVQTFAAVRGEKRLELVFDWGHGAYISDPVAEAEFGENAERKMARIKLDTKAWIDQWLFDQNSLPASPTVEMKADGDACTFVARIQPEDVTKTMLVYSTDGAKTFKKVRLAGDGDRRTATVKIPADQQKMMTFYVEVEYAAKRFLSSLPVLSEKFEEKD